MDIFAAIEAGDMGEVRNYLAAGGEVDVREGEDDATALMRACSDPEVSPAMIELLLQQGADLGATNADGSTCLHYAASAATARQLVAAGAALEYEDDYYETPLFAAIADGNQEVVEALLALGATQLPPPGWRPTALHKAATADEVGILRLLLETGTSPNLADVDGITPLHRARSRAAVELLLEFGADPWRHDALHRDALMTLRNIDAIGLLVAQGLSIHASDRIGYTMLMRAAGDGDIALVQYLLAHDANPNVASQYGNTALMDAATWNYGECVQMLLTAGADMEARDKRGLTALFHAAVPEISSAYRAEIGIDDFLRERERQELEATSGMPVSIEAIPHQQERLKPILAGATNTVRLLLRAGAEVDAQSDEGFTALMLAAQCGHPERLRCLLEAGAKTDLVDGGGRTVFDHLTLNKDDGARGAMRALLAAA